MFDIDDFKKINDTQGHVTGDLIIKQLAIIALHCIREVDLVGRYGGDEFIIFLPNTIKEEAFIIAERLRKNVELAQNFRCTISVGISSYPQDGLKANQLISTADEALYASKKKGKNRVSLT
jgi:diguanylate cyclase (GGDEF)-like protein